MFAKSIVLSDAFLDMPATARCLYFTLSMLADDDGFVDSPKSIMRQCMATDDDMKILLAKSFLIPFESGIVVIRHWRINNYLRCDRYTETKYLDEKASLYIEPNGRYEVIPEKTRMVKNATVSIEAQPELIETEPEVKQMPPANKNVPLIEREPKNDIEKVEKQYLLEYKSLYEQGVLRFEKPVINWVASRKITKDAISKYGIDVVLEAVSKAKNNQFCIEQGFVLTTILSAGVFAGLVNKTIRSPPYQRNVDLTNKLDMSGLAG